MGMSDTQTLLAEIERYIAAAEIAPSTFGQRAVKDGKLVKRLKSGRSVTLETASAIRRFIETGVTAKERSAA